MTFYIYAIEKPFVSQWFTFDGAHIRKCEMPKGRLIHLHESIWRSKQCNIDGSYLCLNFGPAVFFTREQAIEIFWYEKAMQILCIRITKIVDCKLEIFEVDRIPFDDLRKWRFLEEMLHRRILRLRNRKAFEALYSRMMLDVI